MSTPSTATAVLPPHQSFYPHHQQYQSSPTAFINGQPIRATPRVANPPYNGLPSTASTTSATDLRRTVTSNTRHPPPILSPQYPPDMSAASLARDRERRTDWAEFYKNGIPKEVIVIDDDSPDPKPASKATANGVTHNHPAPVHRHADKKRKTGAAYDPVYQPGSYPNHTPYYEHSSSHHNTASTDRTTSAINTTAATSLGSQASAGAYPPPPLDNAAQAGQKRKRTRQAAQDEAKEAKRRELEKLDPLAHYHPPPKPPIKAKDVYVQVISDRHRNRDQAVDDDDGHYNVAADVDLTERYKIIKLLGQGTFGKVVEALDRRKNTRCAIKIIRSVQKYRDASRIELRVLSTLASNDKQNRNKCIHLRDCFDFRNHICIVTDLYGQSVFDFLKANGFVPFPSTHIQSFARQLFTSVAFLHDLNLIHTDLKPENILLVNNAYQTFTYNRAIPSSSATTNRSARHRKVLLDPEIRLIDFGSATFNDEYHSSVVSTRHYRAPEIILNLGWSFPCDIWSIGCILVEFFTGDALFQTHDNLEHLAMMEPVCNGKLERDLVRAVHRNEKSSNRNPAAEYFRGGKLDYPNTETTRASRKYVKAMRKLSDFIPPHTEFNRQFLELLRRIFVYNPNKRITAKEALAHPWFRESILDDGTEAIRIRDSRRRAAEERRLREENESAAGRNGVTSAGASTALSTPRVAPPVPRAVNVSVAARS
ncbi:kinase-like protein [Eremomyces bilateralis CBS 781.70]|uniref:dual-specificity kinase n=1 Tax=Eremomyces bilateralis CBS 781.70 TaxID=1392243 RepID=A0A6G1G1P3_9PEZI|nr:kinase-like protein [Eremomyces bilateralis CBS 781.70]KAF1811729.1 kinase-like protein [Eremomyces bilateralis CBS 781.70]